MSYSIITIVLLVTVTLSSSLSNINVGNERSVYIRFFPNFAQLFQPAKPDFNTSESAREDIERYQFFFSGAAYAQIAEETLTILNADVTERTIVYHPLPNFETVGTRYFYRRDPKESETVEIELVNGQDRLFRETRRPNRFFYLPVVEGLEYTQMPIMPFYEVTFTCNVSRSRDPTWSVPSLSYVDRNFQWTPRYTLDVRATPIMNGYADIRNNGDHPVVIEGLELVAGDVKLDSNAYDFLLSAPQQIREYSSGAPLLRSEASFVRSMDKEASGTYVYETSVPSAFSLAPHSTKSVKFFQADVMVDPFHYYAGEFSPVNARGKLLNAYNITSNLTFIPSGRLSLHQEGRFLGQTKLPDLAVGETYTMVLGYDADLSYQRRVTLLEGNENSESLTYQVEYTFQNDAATSDARIYFVESFGSYKYFEIKNISQSSKHLQSPDLMSYGTDLRGHLVVPPRAGRQTISYQVVIFRVKPVLTLRQ